MTATYDDPNRESVGLAPIWAGAADSAGPESEAGAYDPGEHNVDDVAEYMAAHPDEVDTILAAERAGKNRTTLVGDR